MTTVNEGVLARLTKLVEGLDIEEDDMVTDILVIAKTSNLGDSKVGLCVNYDTSDWIIRRGMLAAALEIETESPLRTRGEEEN